MSCSEKRCETCGCGEIKLRPYEFKLYRVRGLNKPYTRTGRIFGNMMHVIDSSIGIISFGYFTSNLGSEWIIRELDRFFQYNDNEKIKFKLRRFNFKIFETGKISKPFTRSEKVFGYTIKMIDSMVCILTFGHYDSFLHHDFTSRELYKLGKYYKMFN